MNRYTQEEGERETPDSICLSLSVVLDTIFGIPYIRCCCRCNNKTIREHNVIVMASMQPKWAHMCIQSYVHIKMVHTANRYIHFYMNLYCGDDNNNGIYDNVSLCLWWCHHKMRAEHILPLYTKYKIYVHTLHTHNKISSSIVVSRHFHTILFFLFPIILYFIAANGANSCIQLSLRV